MTKDEWLEEEIYVNGSGREPILVTDDPMTYMTRRDAFKKRGYGKKMIKQLWKEIRREENEIRGL